MSSIPSDSIQHINSKNWRKANVLLLKKTISEFAHELLIVPQLLSEENTWRNYVLFNSDQSVKYLFKAQILSLNHWNIKTESLEKFYNGVKTDLNVLDFILEFQEDLGISAELLPTYLEEITSTLYSKSYMIAYEYHTSEELVGEDYQTIEHAMTEGHPCFVANSGRIGFNDTDYIHYSPEANQPIQLIWLAGHKSRATFSGTKEIDYAILLQQELSKEDIVTFNAVLTKKGVDISEYYYFPVHPWQWHNKLSVIFAPDLAENHLVYLGYSADSYSAQQSIRTFFNLSNPEKFYAKTALYS